MPPAEERGAKFKRQRSRAESIALSPFCFWARGRSTSTSGSNVPFQRDSSGRITQITDSLRKVYQYAYDSGVRYPVVHLRVACSRSQRCHRLSHATDFSRCVRAAPRIRAAETDGRQKVPPHLPRPRASVVRRQTHLYLSGTRWIKPLASAVRRPKGFL